MNRYLNSPENLPALVKEDASARLERQSSSDLQSQNSKLYPRMSMPQFLQQMQDGAEKNGLNAQEKEKLKKMKQEQQVGTASALGAGKPAARPAAAPVLLGSTGALSTDWKAKSRAPAPQPRARKPSFFQRIGLLRPPKEEVPRSMSSVKRSWTKIADQKSLVLKDLREENVTRRQSVFAQAEQEFDVFNVKGPMGKGLCIEGSGVHVAFCAGTGVLVFLDLISHMLLRTYYKHYVDPAKVPKEMHQLKDDFTFMFFVSMLSMDSEIGLNMCEALQKVNRKLGETNFKLTVRISKRWDGFRGEVWDKKFVEDQLAPHAGDIRKVWISGPPGMNETLDKSFDELGAQLGVSPHMIDAM